MIRHKLHHFLWIFPVVVIVVLLAWVLGTTSGLMFAVNTATTYGGLSLQHQNLHGTLASRIVADRITYQNESTKISLNNLDTAFSLLWLLDARLAFDDTRLDKVTVTIKNNQETKKGQTPVTLPVGISFHSLSIKQIAIENEKPVIEINQLVARKIKIRKELELDKLQFGIANTKLALDGSMGFGKTSDIDMKATWDISPAENVPAMAGHSTVTGNFGKLFIDTELGTPLAAQLKAQIDNIFDNLQWKATLSSEAIDTGLINNSFNTKLHTIKAELNGDLKTATIQGTGIVIDPQYGQWNTILSATFTETKWQIPDLQLVSPETNSHIQIQAQSTGDSPYKPTSAIDLSMAWQQLQWPVKGNPDYYSEQGNTRINGNLENYHIKLSGNFGFRDYRFNDIAAEGNGTATTLKLDSLTTSYLDGTWQGNTSLDWSQGFQWQAALKVAGANPAVQWQSLSGQLDGTVTGEGKHQGDNWQITGNIEHLSGKFHDFPVKGNSQFSVSASEYAFSGLNLRSGENSVQGSIAISDYLGDTTPQVRANWNVNAKNLSQIMPDTSGIMISKGKAHGSLLEPIIDGEVSVEKLKYQNYVFSKADLIARVDLQHNSEMKIGLNAEGSSINGTELKELLLNVTGKTHAHSISVDTQTKDGESAQLRANGGYKNYQWDGKVTALSIDAKNYGNWKLTQVFPIKVSNSGVIVSNACTTQESRQSSVCFNIASDAYTTYKIDGTITKLSLNLLRSIFPERITSIYGTVEGNTHLLIDNQNIKELELSLENEGGELTHTLVNDEPRTIQFKKLSIKAEHTRQSIVATSHIDLQKTANADASVTLSNISTLSDIDAQTPVSGNVDVKINDLSLLPVFFPDIQAIEGKTSSRFHISGTLGNPQLTGKGKFVAERITLPLIGLELKNTELHTRSTSSRKIIIEGKTQSGDGYINVKGEIPDYAADRLLVKLEIDGKNFLAVKIPDVEMEMSPKLTLILDGNTVNMNGDVYIEKAHISPLDTYSGLTPSSDVVFIDPKSQREQQEPFKLLGTINLRLSEQVYVQGGGFVGRITGELAVSESASNVTLATGELLIKDGRYTATVNSDNIPSLLVSIAQKELLIDDSKLIFAATPIDNPRLDIHARRPTANEVVVGVDIKGHANNPQVLLYSEPAMDQADILAYLTLGYPLNEASKKDGQYLARIASSIGLVGGEKLAKGIAKEFGIDEVYIQSEDTTQQAQLVLGKYLSPKLYVRYAVGIGEAVDTLQIQYKLTDKLILRTESADNQTGTDLIYTIEKD